MAGEPGYATPLTAPAWGFEKHLFDGQAIRLGRPLGSYVMENVLFKVSFPAEFHGQTAVEAALQLHPLVKDRLEQVERIRIETQEPAVRIITRDGPLQNPAARDHCLQYMVAVVLIHGTLTADHYEDETAADPRIDRLRDRMEVVEEPAYSRDYLDPDRRSIANAVQVWFDDGSSTGRIAVEYPLGHRRRRDEARPQLMEKFRQNASTCLTDTAVQTLAELIDDPARFDRLPVPEFVNLTLKTPS
jgi:2-methylcitrate dehydratase